MGLGYWWEGELQALCLDGTAVGHMRIPLLPATLGRAREVLRCSCEVRHLRVTHLDPAFFLVVWLLSFAPFLCTQSLKYLWALQSFIFLGTPKLLFPASSLSQLGHLSWACIDFLCVFLCLILSGPGLGELRLFVLFLRNPPFSETLKPEFRILSEGPEVTGTIREKTLSKAASYFP